MVRIIVDRMDRIIIMDRMDRIITVDLMVRIITVDLMDRTARTQFITMSDFLLHPPSVSFVNLTEHPRFAATRDLVDRTVLPVKAHLAELAEDVPTQSTSSAASVPCAC